MQKKIGVKTFGDDNDIIYADTQTSGKDWFTFTFYPNSAQESHHKKGLEPYLSGWDGTEENLRTHPSAGCRPTLSGTAERAFCAALIQRNGWKIPDDYPIKF